MSHKYIDLNLDEFEFNNEYEEFAAQLTLECFNNMDHEELVNFLIDCMEYCLDELCLDSYRIISFVVTTMYDKIMERCFHNKCNLDMVMAHRMEVLTRKKKQDQVADVDGTYYDFLWCCYDLIVDE